MLCLHVPSNIKKNAPTDIPTTALISFNVVYQVGVGRRRVVLEQCRQTTKQDSQQRVWYPLNAYCILCFCCVVIYFYAIIMRYFLLTMYLSFLLVYSFFYCSVCTCLNLSPIRYWSIVRKSQFTNKLYVNLTFYSK